MNGVTRIKNFDLAHLKRWKDYFPNTYWVNFQEETMRDVRNMILIQRPGFDQSTESIYPFLAIRRVGIPEPKEEQNLSAANRGYRNGREEYRLTYTNYTLTYNVDIYAADRDTLDELTIEICDTFYRNPCVDVLTGDEKMPYISTNIFYQSLTDNSDLQGAEDEIRVFRATVVYTADAPIIRKFKHLNIGQTDIEYVRKG